jgi:hypothetical protein
MLSKLGHALSALLQTLLAGFCLAFGYAPKAIKALRPMPHFWLMLLAQVPMSYSLQKLNFWGFPILVSAQGLFADALFGLCVLAACTALASVCKRTHLSYSLASLILAASLFLAPMFFFVLRYVHVSKLPQLGLYLCVAMWLWMCFRTGSFVLQGSVRAVRSMGALAMGAALFALSLSSLMQAPRYVLPDQAVLSAEEADLRPPPPAFDAEAVMYAQRMLLERALASVPLNDPTRAQMYLLALAGDADTPAFLHEALYAQTLFGKRFMLGPRTLVLANSPVTTAQYPLATLTNLRLALAGLAKKMGPEDALFLFLSSHGSPNFELYVNLDPLPLNQITPKNLHAALADAGIQRHFSLVSACFSGGYLEALSSVDSLVMTAARADRSSFGCAPDADLTYFGRAYLLQGMNQSKDLVKAFEIAERAIESRERAEQLTPSLPQIRIGRGAREWLNEWERSFEPGEAVPYFNRPLRVASAGLAESGSNPENQHESERGNAGQDRANAENVN